MSAHPLEAELVARVEDWITRDPRSLQTRIGPSEVGNPCQRRLGHKLAGTPEITQRIGWKPAVGRALHNEFAMIFDVAARNGDGNRWLVEEKVDTGQLDGEVIDGSTDLFDTVTGTVVDWKFVSKARLRGYRAKGPGDQYRIQAHAYGRGWAARGHTVTTVAVFFWTRDGEFTDRWFWHEPFDPAIAADAFSRLQGVADLLTALTPAVALPLLPTAEAFCSHCPYWRPNTQDLVTGCPGHPGSRAAAAAPATLADALGTN